MAYGRIAEERLIGSDDYLLVGHVSMGVNKSDHRIGGREID